QTFRPILVHVTPGVLLLGVIDERVHIALERSIAARRVCVESAARLDGEVRRLLHRLDGKVPRRLDHDTTLAADPGNDGGPVFIVVAAAGLALLAPATRAAAQRLLAAPCGLALVAGGVREVIGFHRPCQLALHLIGQGGIAQPPAPAIACTAMHPYSQNIRTRLLTAGYTPIITRTSTCLPPHSSPYSAPLWMAKAEGETMDWK